MTRQATVYRQPRADVGNTYSMIVFGADMWAGHRLHVILWLLLGVLTVGAFNTADVWLSRLEAGGPKNKLMSSAVIGQVLLRTVYRSHFGVSFAPPPWEQPELCGRERAMDFSKGLSELKSSGAEVRAKHIADIVFRQGPCVPIRIDWDLTEIATTNSRATIENSENLFSVIVVASEIADISIAIDGLGRVPSRISTIDEVQVTPGLFDEFFKKKPKGMWIFELTDVEILNAWNSMSVEIVHIGKWSILHAINNTGYVPTYLFSEPYDKANFIEFRLRRKIGDRG